MLQIDKRGRLCVAGHIGVGHLFSHSGFVQDDSQGFLSVVKFAQEIFGIKIEIKEIQADKESIRVYTSCGGIGIGKPRRGLTPFEVNALKRVEGVNPLLIQRSALEVFGRFYGNGVSEGAVSFMYALAESLLDSLSKVIPESVILRAQDDICSDVVWGVNANLNGVPLTLVATINGSRMGLGPCEDLEGNVYRGIKYSLLKKLGGLRVPTIVVESKVFNPAIEVKEETFVVRYNADIDNSTVALSLREALKELSLPFLFIDNAFPLTSKPSIGLEMEKFISNLSKLVRFLSRVKSSKKKALLFGELAKLVSEDAGGVVFMSSKVNRLARAVGLMPGTGAVISTCVSKGYVDEYRIPFVDEEDIRRMVMVLKRAIFKLWDRIEEAKRELILKFRNF